MRVVVFLAACFLASAAHAQNISVDDVSGLPTGPAAGSLSGTYPNPAIASGVALTNPALLGTVTGANSCTVIVTINGATGLTAPNGWSCAVEDTSALTVLISQSASSATTASFSVPVTAGATDVIKFFCMGY